MKRERNRVERAVDEAMEGISCYGMSSVSVRYETLNTGNAEIDGLLGVQNLRKMVIEVIYDLSVDDGRVFFHSGASILRKKGLWERLKARIW